MVGPWPQRMVNPIRDYDWGSQTVLARMQRRSPTGRPEAELWMGAHPSDPSMLEQDDGTLLRLDAVVEEHGLDLLGSHVHGLFGSRLPFLLKVLAIARPLSVQVHPSSDRARAGFEGEIGAVEHHYTDPFHKPEMLYALQPVDALCGFRTADSARHLLGLLGGERTTMLARLLDSTGSESERLEAVLRTLVTWPDDDRAALAADVARDARRLLAEAGPFRPDADLSGEDRRALMWASRLAVQHPKDPLVAAPFVLDLVRLEPGEVMFVPDGAPHAYLHGLGVEIMANSDNVLRAGLTHKPVAVKELLTVVQGDSRPVRDVPFRWLSPAEVVWTPQVADFALSRIWVADGRPVTAFPGIAGPQVLLCTSGAVTVTCAGRSIDLRSGESAFVGASGGTISLVGLGEVFRASAGGQQLPGA